MRELKLLVIFSALILVAFILGFNRRTGVKLAYGDSCQAVNAECKINESGKACCAGLVCMDKGVPSNNGKCELASSPSPSPIVSPTPSPTPVVDLTCDGDIPSSLMVNVTQTVTNDVDSGFHGNWAIDNYIRHIKVWRLQSQGRIYCADVRYDGTFDVLPGVLSPQNGNVLTGNEDGNMTGGRRAEIFGSFLESPAWPATGDVGSYDYGCTISGACSGRFNWVTKYFNAGFEYEDLNWGWTYTSCGHGQWVNASTGSYGDIVVGPTREVCQTPTPTPAPTSPSCGSDEHLDLSGTKCLKWELGGPPAPPFAGNNVLGASTTSSGKVLGASTMAKTGTAEETLFNFIFILGSGLTALGLRKFRTAI